VDSRIKEALQQTKSFIDAMSDISYHSQGMGCGIEDLGITDRYDACRFGWEHAIEQVSEQMPETDVIDEALSLLTAEPEPCEGAEATLKFAIFDGIANSFGKSPEQIRDTIYKNITSPELRWALEALSSHCEQEAMADERRRCAEELDARAGWKQHIETIIKLINSEVDCVQTKNGAYVNLDGVLGCLKYSG